MGRNEWLEIVGVALLAAGLGFVFWPLALIVLGAFTFLAGFVGGDDA